MASDLGIEILIQYVALPLGLLPPIVTVACKSSGSGLSQKHGLIGRRFLLLDLKVMNCSTYMRRSVHFSIFPFFTCSEASSHIFPFFQRGSSRDDLAILHGLETMS